MLLSTAVFASNAFADVKVNGFLSAHTGVNFDDKSSVLGYDNDLSFNQDSLAGLQFSYPINNKLYTTVQFVARGQDDFNVDVEWAYFNYKLTDSLDIQGGRIRVPWYALSNYIDARQSYHWTRAPQSVYFLPFNSFDGLKVRHSNELGDWNSLLSVSVGRYQNDSYTDDLSDIVDSNFEAKNWFNVSWDLQTENHRIFASFSDASVTWDIEQINTALNAFRAAGFESLADDIAVQDRGVNTYNLGYFYDNAEFLLHTEYTLFTLGGFLANQESMYLSAGYYLDELLVHATVERRNGIPQHNILNGIPNSSPIGASAHGVVYIEQQTTDTYSLGLTYALYPNVSIKTQLSVEDRKTLARGTSKGQVLTLGLDLTF